MKLGNIELRWLGHSSFLIKDSKAIYIDPYNVRSVEKADIILITHPHYDHCSVADINRVAKDGTIIVVPAACQSKITKLDKKIEMQIIEPGQTISLDSVKVGAVPAYNTNKPNHPKSEGWLGYIIKIKNLIIYHAGDTDLIPEMKKLTGYGKAGNEFLALLPVGGTYTMDAEQASEAASTIQPTLAIPMHWGAIIGSANDAEEFVKLCREKGIKAEILRQE